MILVTGASGLLGSNLLWTLHSWGEEALGLYRSHPVRLPGIETVRADVTDAKAVRDLVRRHCPAWVVHCAALTNVDLCEEKPEEARRVNVEATRRLAEAAVREGSRFLYVSTDSVFDGGRGSYTEDDAPGPVNAYARSKLEGESAALEAAPGALVVRTNLFGWSPQPAPSMAEWMLGRLESGEGLDGWQDVVFTPLLANDLAGVLIEMLRRGLGGLYHTAGPEPVSKYDFALRLADAFGFDRRLVRPSSSAEARLRTPRPKNTSLSTEKLRKALERDLPGIQDGLRGFKALRESGLPFSPRQRASKENIHAQN